MERDPLLSPTPDTLLALKKSEDAVQARRGFMVTAFAGILSLYGVHRIREADLDTCSVKSALDTVVDASEIGGVPVQVQNMDVKNATHAAVVVAMPPLAERARTDSMLTEFVKPHMTADVANIIVSLYRNEGASVFGIDDRTFFEELSYLKKALEWSDDYSLKIELRNGIRSDTQLGTIGETDGKIQEAKYQTLADQAATLFEQYRFPAEQLLGDNPELVRLLLRKEIRIEPLEPLLKLSQSREHGASNPYTNPNHTPEQIRAFLHEKAEEWQNVVILSGQPDRIAEAIQAFNAEKGPAFSAAIVTPDRPSPAVKGGDDIATRNHP